MKKVLSIVLSLVMVLCLTPAMAFAGTDEAVGTSFSDADSITHSEAVYSLAALNIINGYTDGTYKPAKTVTRAEMCKMIATLYNGGTEPVLSTTTTSYTDTKGHWAAGYIEYCTSLGIVAGVGGGRFSPDATVTAEQAAKMLLIAQGYNADVEGLVGASWAGNTNVLANQNDYYKELADISTGAGLVREHAAQMIYNGLDAKVIKKSNSVNQATGEVITIYEPSEQSVANKYLSLQEKSAVLNAISYNEKDAEYEYSIGTVKDDDDKDVADIYKSSVNYTALFGQNVKVLYKVEKNKTVVYGMYADDSSVLYEGVWGDVDATTLKNKKVKIDGTEYKLDGSDIPTPIAEYTGKAAESSVPAYAAIKVIDIDNDGDIDKITYSPVSVGEITYVGKTQFTIKMNQTTETKNFDDVVAYDNMEKNDLVAVSHDLKTDKTAYTELETLKDVKVTSTKGDTATIDGKAYENAAGLTAGSEYDAVGILNGYVVIAKGDTTKGDVTDYAVVTGTKIVNDYKVTYKAMLLMSDGTETEVTTDKDYQSLNGQMVTYEVSDEKYELTAAATTAKDTGFDVAAASGTFVKKTTDNPAKITIDDKNYGINDNAVIFVKSEKDDETVYSVIKGSDLAAKTTAEIKNVYAEENDSTGYTNVVLAYIESAATETTTYAYVTDDPIKNVADGKTSYTLTLSTGEFVTIDGLADAADLKKGDVISYTLNDDKKVKKVTTISEKSAVTAYDGTNITLEGLNAMKFTDDATIIYIDSDAKTVAEGGTIALADKNSDGNYVKNVIYAKGTGDDANKIDLLVVDVNNEMQ